jgi:hypothetical protein
VKLDDLWLGIPLGIAEVHFLLTRCHLSGQRIERGGVFMGSQFSLLSL